MNYHVYPVFTKSMIIFIPGCGLTSYTGTQGSVVSPNYPNNYPSSTDCLYSISWNAKTAVSLVFNPQFWFESCCDFIVVRSFSNSRIWWPGGYDSEFVTDDSVAKFATMVPTYKNKFHPWQDNVHLEPKFVSPRHKFLFEVIAQVKNKTCLYIIKLHTQVIISLLSNR